jgi:hypothetical protein
MVVDLVIEHSSKLEDEIFLRCVKKIKTEVVIDQLELERDISSKEGEKKDSL